MTPRWDTCNLSSRVTHSIAHPAIAKLLSNHISAWCISHMVSETTTPICYVNGKRHELPQGRAEASLIAWLRGQCRFQLRKPIWRYTRSWCRQTCGLLEPVTTALCRDWPDRNKTWLLRGWLWSMYSHGLSTARHWPGSPLCQRVPLPLVCCGRHACGDS